MDFYVYIGLGILFILFIVVLVVALWQRKLMSRQASEI